MDIRKNEKGQLMLEAALVYPMVMIVFVFFLYILLLFAQKAQVVSAAEQTMVYIKHVCSGNFNLDSIDPSNGLDTDNAWESANAGLYNVYVNMFKTPSSKVNELKSRGKIQEIFDYYMHGTLLSNTECTVEAEATNYVIFTQLELEVKCKRGFFLNFSFVGGEALNEPEFTVNLKGVISDNAETVRTLQYVDYLLYKTGLGDKIKDTIDKIKNFMKF